jgi:hypothetical protein
VSKFREPKNSKGKGGRMKKDADTRARESINESMQEDLRQEKDTNRFEAPAVGSKPIETETKHETKTEKSGGKQMADKDVREGLFDSFTRFNESVFSLEGVKKAAAWYIETSEKFANQAVELQEKATGWAKETPLAPLFEAQSSLARKFIERSASTARNLWQIQPSNSGYSQ